MKRLSVTLLFVAIGNVAAADRPAGQTVFVGQYGHDASEPAYEPVWAVTKSGDAWQAGFIEDGAATRAYRVSARGRAAFWEKMDWPAATAAEADCLSWGEAFPGLLDMLEDRPTPAPPDTFGYAILCHVPVEAREAISWLANESEDWFYYDPVAGVMSVRRLPLP